MVKASQPWNLREPKINNRGQPAIHDIASILGCIPRNRLDLDLPLELIFPENEADMAKLASELEGTQAENDSPEAVTESDSSSYQPQSLPCSCEIDIVPPTDCSAAEISHCSDITTPCQLPTSIDRAAFAFDLNGNSLEEPALRLQIDDMSAQHMPKTQASGIDLYPSQGLEAPECIQPCMLNIDAGFL